MPFLGIVVNCKTLERCHSEQSEESLSCYQRDPSVAEKASSG